MIPDQMQGAAEGDGPTLDEVLRLADEHAEESYENGDRRFDRGGLHKLAKDLLRRFGGEAQPKHTEPEPYGTDTELLDLIEREGLAIGVWSDGSDGGGWQIERHFAGLKRPELLWQGMDETPLRDGLRMLAGRYRFEGRIDWKHGDPEAGDPGVMGIKDVDGNVERLEDEPAATQAPAPAAVARVDRDAQEQPFEDYWLREGQFGRAGGGHYEKTFAWNAWCAAIETQGPDAAPRKPVKAADVRAYMDKNHCSLNEAMAALFRPTSQMVPVPDGLTRSDADFWLRKRGEIIDALSAEGLTMVSSVGGVRLMRLGKIEAQAATPSPAPAPVGLTGEQLDGIRQALLDTASDQHDIEEADRIVERILSSFKPTAQAPAVKAEPLSNETVTQILNRVWPLGGKTPPAIGKIKLFASLIEAEIRAAMGEAKPPVQGSGA